MGGKNDFNKLVRYVRKYGEVQYAKKHGKVVPKFIRCRFYCYIPITIDNVHRTVTSITYYEKDQSLFFVNRTGRFKYNEDAYIGMVIAYFDNREVYGL